MKPLKRVVLKEELFVLTGDFKKAILLNQFIYWSERISDFDQFIAEEKERCAKHNIENNQEFQNGWIYKSAEDLSEETMLGLSKSNIGIHVKDLIDKGWLSERNNPIFKWDRTKQYRVNIAKIQKDLQNIGYALEGYPLLIEEVSEGDKKEIFDNNAPCSKIENGENTQKPNLLDANSKIEHRGFKTENASSKIENHSSILKHQCTRNETAIPEITTENTIDIYNQSIISHHMYDVPDKIDRVDETKKQIIMDKPIIKEKSMLEKYNNYLNLLRKNLEYEVLKSDKVLKQELDEIIELMLSILISNKEKMRINSEDISTEIVRAQFLRLKYEHVEYVMNCLKANTGEINNIKAYLLTALYNAPMTMKKYYASKTNQILNN